MKEIFEALTSDASSILEEERRHIAVNLRYANNVLFETGEIDRQKQVRLLNSVYGKFQTQGSSNYCGLCCVNNAIGIPDTGPLVTVQCMDQVADKLWMEMGVNPSLGFRIPLEPMRDREGFYSIEVIQSVLHDHGFDILPVCYSFLLNLPPVDIAVTLTKQLKSEYGIATFIIRPRNSQHWLCIKVNGEQQFVFLDSKLKEPRFLAAEEFGTFILETLQSSRDASGAVYFLRPFEEQYIRDGMSVDRKDNCYMDSANNAVDQIPLLVSKCTYSFL